MEEKVKNIQARLKAALSQTLTLGRQFEDIPIVTFEEVAGLPSGAETLVYEVIAELKGRGYRVANIRRFSVNTVLQRDKSSASPYMQAGSDATLLVLPDRMVLAKQATGDASLDDMISLLGNDYDVIIGESFGYLSVPKFLVTDKVQEGFNLGLPNVIGYVSEKDAGAVIPRFSPRDIKAIADKIESYIIDPHAADRMSVVVNGSPIPLSESKKGLINEMIVSALPESGESEPMRNLHVMISRHTDESENTALTGN